MIALVDYGAGNLASVRKALAFAGAAVWTPASADELWRASGIVVPGVGHFETTAALDDRWRDAIRAALARVVPLLGICVGLQWLFEGSEEAPGVAGLGLVPGVCTRLGGGADPRQDLSVPGPDSPLVRPQASPNGPAGPGLAVAEPAALKVPHVGWNALTFPRQTRLLAGLPEGAHVYFTHSYAAPLGLATAAVTTYGRPFAAAVEDGPVFGVQFHPEKSGAEGIRVLRNWLDVVNAR